MMVLKGEGLSKRKEITLLHLKGTFRSSDLGAVFGFFVWDSTLVPHPININLIISIGMFSALDAMLIANNTE
jgi:hypothetical protein